MEKCDVLVIGAGSAGVRFSRLAAEAGKNVVVADSGPLGGTCVNVGCVPKKLFSYASHIEQDIKDAHGYGWNISSATFDWQTLRENKSQEISRLNGIYRSLLEKSGVTLIQGQARFIDNHTLEINDILYQPKHIVIATGGRPRRPNIPGAELGYISDDLFSLHSLPSNALVIGGGYIAVEFAGILQGLGSVTALLYRGPLFMRGFDRVLREALAEEMQQHGIKLSFNTDLTKIEKTETGLIAHTTLGTSLETDAVFFAIGRNPNTEHLGLEHTDVKQNQQGAIQVDSFSRTSVPHIFALGDVTNRMNLTPVAIHEAMCLIQTLYHETPKVPDYSNVATAVFSQPPIATVGLTTEQALEKGINIDTYTTRFRPLKNTLSENPEKTSIRLIVESTTDRIIGLHMIGVDAPEIMQGFAAAIKCGITKSQLDQVIGIHPTTAEEIVTLRNKDTDE